MKPNLGQKVYILYESFLLCETVEMLGKDSFATPLMFSSITRDEYRIPIGFNEYGETWFISLAEAERYLESRDEISVKISKNTWRIEERSKKMINIKAEELNVGQEFYYSGRKFVALGWEQKCVLAVAKEPIKDIPFDKDGSNDWRSSSLREYLNRDFLNDGFDRSGLMPFASDLTADDGLTDYGESLDLVFLLSADLYRKYRYQMPKWGTWVWLITPWSCLHSNRYFVRIVTPDGSLNINTATYDGNGVAVACLINPESSVICAEEHKEGNNDS